MVQVLSVVATQVKTVQDCIKKLAVVSNRDPEYQHLPPGLPPVKIGNFMFEGDMISLTPSKTCYAVLCYAVLCCAVLCCAVLCCAVLCCAVLCYAILLCYAAQSHACICCTSSCYFVLSYLI